MYRPRKGNIEYASHGESKKKKKKKKMMMMMMMSKRRRKNVMERDIREMVYRLGIQHIYIQWAYLWWITVLQPFTRVIMFSLN